ncbi:DNA methyltransferase [Paenibacillus sp. PvR148]
MSTDKNALIEGENIEIMQSLLKKGYEELFHLVYCDGPFNSGLLFSATQPEFGLEYIYPWSQHETIHNYFNLQLYLDHYRKRITLAKQLLREDGIFVLQTNMVCGHHLKVLLDEIFGRENFQCEVIWKHSDTPWENPWGFPVGYQHETVLFYSKSARFAERLHTATNWPSVWDDITGYQYGEEEETRYPSQKPEKLVERILDIATKEGDWVADFYCGSGTLPYVAEKKRRRWLACDNTPLSMKVTQERLRKIEGSFNSYYTVDEFEPRCFVRNEYVKRRRTAVSAREIQALQNQNDRIDVTAYHFLPDVDLVNETGQFTFYYQFPLISEEGISETQTVKVARPIPVKGNDGIRLVVPNEFEWILHHMVLVEKNSFSMLNVSRYDKDYKHIFHWDQALSKAREWLHRMKGKWIIASVEEDGVIKITDLFGYKYALPK